MIVVHDSFIQDAEADLRVANKTAIRSNTEYQDNLTGTHQTSLYS